MGPCHSVKKSPATQNKEKAVEPKEETVPKQPNPKPEKIESAQKLADDDDNLLEIGVMNYEEWLKKSENLKEKQKNIKKDEPEDSTVSEKGVEKSLFKRITDLDDPAAKKEEDPNYLIENQALTVRNKSQMAKFLKDLDSLSVKLHTASFLLSEQLVLDNEAVLDLGKCIKPLGSLKHLELDLGSNRIKKVGISNLASIFPSLTNLEVLKLNLTENKFGEESCGFLAKSLTEKTRLKKFYMDFKSSHLGDKGTLEFIKGCLKIDTLDTFHLGLGYNKLTNECITEVIADVSSRAKNLININFNFEHNELDADGFIQFSKHLINFKNVTTLKMNFETLNNGMNAIGKALSTLTHLEVLALSFETNLLSDDVTGELAENLVQLQNLSTLDLNLRDNGIRETGTRILFTCLGYLKKLVDVNLNLSKNTISGALNDELTNEFMRINHIKDKRIHL